MPKSKKKFPIESFQEELLCKVLKFVIDVLKYKVPNALIELCMDFPPNPVIESEPALQNSSNTTQPELQASQPELSASFIQPELPDNSIFSQPVPGNDQVSNEQPAEPDTSLHLNLSETIGSIDLSFNCKICSSKYEYMFDLIQHHKTEHPEHPDPMQIINYLEDETR